MGMPLLTLQASPPERELVTAGADAVPGCRCGETGCPDVLCAMLSKSLLLESGVCVHVLCTVREGGL